MTVPAGTVTVLRGTREQRRRLFVLLAHDPARARGERVVHHVTVSPSSNAARRAESLLRAVDRPVDVVLVDNVTGGLDARARRSLLGLLRRLADAGPAVVVDDRDPLAAMAVGDHTLSLDAHGTPVLHALADLPLPEQRAAVDAAEPAGPGRAGSGPAGPNATPPSRTA